MKLSMTPTGVSGYSLSSMAPSAVTNVFGWTKIFLGYTKGGLYQGFECLEESHAHQFLFQYKIPNLTHPGLLWLSQFRIELPSTLAIGSALAHLKLYKKLSCNDLAVG